MSNALRDPIRDDYVATVEAENETLRERIRHLESMLGYRLTIPIMFDLTASEGRMLSAMLTRDLMSRQQLLDALYGHKPVDDEPEIKIIDVYACKMRKKLKPFGIYISSKWGQGYYLTKEAKAKVQEYLATETSA